MPYIITREQRDALREEAIASLAEIGDVYLAIENDDWPLAELLSTRNATVLELLHDLGWEPDKVSQQVLLRLPAPSLSLAAQHLCAVAADRLDSHRQHGLIDDDGYAHADDVRHCRLVVEICPELLARTGPAPAAMLRWAAEMSV
ncbi:hypothetical protein [Conexibacter woesei]|uniref:Uncharacterized protein n=1 Tax=Conexibacter woesei (strain DSM 14684 / CCUG 47730 / CIP 108061 / JCM 11494 / NBRC 100937 / ID131577) TaxID=469383 RepID=D3F9F4_CONWI|nr:hypothetical protein [Conexibacter woesei]ADB49121.1 hypothetical protein Cwoe_0687 [Conexibacter woesei DSM 14684]